MPIVVLTHEVPERVAKGENGSLTFTFVTDGIESAIEKAKAVAGDKYVTVIGGANTFMLGERFPLLHITWFQQRSSSVSRKTWIHAHSFFAHHLGTLYTQGNVLPESRRKTGYTTPLILLTVGDGASNAVLMRWSCAAGSSIVYLRR